MNYQRGYGVLIGMFSVFFILIAAGVILGGFAVSSFDASQTAAVAAVPGAQK